MQLPRATRLVVRIAGERMYLWRAVDNEGEASMMTISLNTEVSQWSHKVLCPTKSASSLRVVSRATNRNIGAIRKNDRARSGSAVAIECDVAILQKFEKVE